MSLHTNESALVESDSAELMLSERHATKVHNQTKIHTFFLLGSLQICRHRHNGILGRLQAPECSAATCTCRISIGRRRAGWVL